MRDLTPPEPILREPPRRKRPIIWTVAASLMLHAGLLTLLLLPQRDTLEAAPPPAIDVELVPPPEASSTPPPTDEQSSVEPQSASGSEGPAPESAAAAASSPADALAEPAAREEASAEETPDQPASVEEPAGSGEAAQPTAEAPAAEAAAAAEPQPSAEAPQRIAPVPLSRPSVRGLTAPSSAAEEGAAAPVADASEPTDALATGEAAAEPDVATLELGTVRSAGRFYLEAMLGSPGMERARDVLPTLPPDKRLAQTCNIEALAQIGYAGEGFAPDVVMAEAYARSEVAGTQLTAAGAIFRSKDKWYGFAFDCTLSEDLSRVTAFSYRLGADVTDAVLARLSEN